MTKAELKRLKKQAKIKNKAILQAHQYNDMDNLKLSLNGKMS